MLKSTRNQNSVEETIAVFKKGESIATWFSVDCGIIFNSLLKYDFKNSNSACLFATGVASLSGDGDIVFNIPLREMLHFTKNFNLFSFSSSVASGVDEQAQCLAPGKRDFMTHRTLRA